jgi:hypothetical protein
MNGFVCQEKSKTRCLKSFKVVDMINWGEITGIGLISFNQTATVRAIQLTDIYRMLLGLTAGQPRFL